MTKIAVPVPLLIAIPSKIPEALATEISVSPMLAGALTVVVTANPPEPTVPDTCVPELMPVPLIGEPNGGKAPAIAIWSVPLDVINLVVNELTCPLL